MDGYYPPNQLSPQQMQRQLSHQHQQQFAQQQNHAHHGQHPPPLNMAAANAMNPQHGQPLSASMVPDSSLMSSDSLDDIIRDNQSELIRRRSMPQAYGNPMAPGNPQSPRRMSAVGTGDMMGFGPAAPEMGNYPFSQSMGPPPTYPTINTNMNMSNQMGNYMNAEPTDYPGISPDMMGSMMTSNFANMSVGPMGNRMGNQMGNQMGNLMGNQSTAPMGNNSPVAMNYFSPVGPNPITTQFPAAQIPAVANDFTMDLTPDDVRNLSAQSMGAEGHDSTMVNAPPAFNQVNQSQLPTSMPMDSSMDSYTHSMPSLSRHVSNATSVLTPPQGASHGTSASTNITQPSTNSEVATPSNAPTPRDGKESNVYSKSGFDMLKALWLVATRKDPRIHLGAVDMSCAFVVCDVTMNDCPIIYVSDNFQNLTGYSRHEIVGQNCRFLQAPDGKVEAGSKREFVDDGAVYNLKKMIQEGKEVQQSLINYRKGGKPFLNLLTMIPIPWDTDEIRYFIGFQIDLVECPDAIASNQEFGGMKVNYKHSDIGQYIWTPPSSAQWEPENGQTLGLDDVSTLLQQFNPKGIVSDWHKQSWDKMLLENTDDVIHVLSLKGLFLYLSPASKRVLEYDAADLVGNSLSTVCHPSDIVPVTRELKETTAGNSVNIVFRIRRKNSGYTWFESHGSLFVEQGKGRKCIVLVGRKRPVFALSRRNLEASGGIGDSELWTKLSTSGMFLYVSSNIRSLLDLQPENLVGTSIQELMRKESRPEFGRAIEKARRGKIVTCKHEVQNRRGQVLQAQTILYPGDAVEGQKPSFLLAQTKLLKASSRSIAPAGSSTRAKSITSAPLPEMVHPGIHPTGQISEPAGGALSPGSQDAALASDDNLFNELRTTKCSSWQFELRQMEKVNRILAEELGGLLSNKKKRKRRKGVGNIARDCANCHTRNTPEWRRGPSGQRDLCNSCGLRWAKQTGRVSPRNSSRGGAKADDVQTKKSASPIHSSPLHKDITAEALEQSNSHGDGLINPAQLSNALAESTSAAPSGAPSATGVKPSAMMPPPSHSSMMSGIPGVSMTAIREERESSQP